jgi:hypothetical protein
MARLPLLYLLIRISVVLRRSSVSLDCRYELPIR